MSVQPKTTRKASDERSDVVVYVRTPLARVNGPTQAFAAITEDVARSGVQSENGSEWTFTFANIVFTVSATDAR